MATRCHHPEEAQDAKGAVTGSFAAWKTKLFMSEQKLPVSASVYATRANLLACSWVKLALTVHDFLGSERGLS